MKTMKKTLAVFLAVLCVFAAFSVAGSAEDVNIPMTARTAEKATFTITGFDDYAFCVMPEGTPITGIESKIWQAWNVNCGDDSTAGNKKSWIDVSKSMLEAMFPNGEISDQYVVYGRREISANTYSYAKSSTFRFAPLAPVVIDKTENTVTVRPNTDCVYKWEYYNADTKQFKNGASGTWKSTPTLDDEWQTSNVLTNIEAGSTVAVFARYSGISGSDIKASLATYSVASTYKKAPNKPAAPQLADYTKDTISVTLTEEFPVEFSIDEGKSWFGKTVYDVATGTYTSIYTFDKLTKSTMYSIIARGTVAEDQLEGEHSLALTVKTADRNRHEADPYSCTVELPGDEIKAGNSATLVAKGDALDSDPLEGDTRCIPVSWVATIGGAEIAAGDWATVATKQTVDISTNKATDLNYSGTVEVTVTFVKQEYANGTWNYVSQSTNSSTFTVKSYNVFDYLLGVLNAGLTTIFTAIGTVYRYLIGLVSAK